MLQVNIMFLILNMANSERLQEIHTCDRETTELSSFTASSTSKRFGLSLWRKIAVDRSSSLKIKYIETFKIRGQNLSFHD